MEMRAMDYIIRRLEILPKIRNEFRIPDYVAVVPAAERHTRGFDDVGF
jgi:hypothetical protein